jgi:hypothetical protein
VRFSVRFRLEIESGTVNWFNTTSLLIILYVKPDVVVALAFVVSKSLLQ